MCQWIAFPNSDLVGNETLQSALSCSRTFRAKSTLRSIPLLSFFFASRGTKLTGSDYRGILMPSIRAPIVKQVYLPLHNRRTRIIAFCWESVAVILALVLALVTVHPCRSLNRPSTDPIILWVTRSLQGFFECIMRGNPEVQVELYSRQFPYGADALQLWFDRFVTLTSMAARNCSFFSTRCFSNAVNLDSSR